MLRAFKTGVLYFAVVFGVGFVFGTIRTLWIVPRLGARTAELLEAPVMVAVSFIVARWIVRRIGLRFALPQRIGMGAIALVLLLTAEFSLLAPLREISIHEYFTTLDPVSGPVYYFALLLFALAPIVVQRNGDS